MHPPTERVNRIPWLVGAWLAATAAGAFAQTAAGPTRRVTALTRFVPADAKLFISVRELAEADEALERAHVWSIVPWLMGRDRAAGDRFDLQRAVTNYLGEHSDIDRRELFTTEVGFVSPDWQSLDPIAWLVRLPRPDSADRWFPVEKRMGGGAATGRGFRMADGLVVRIKDDVAAIGRRSDDASALRDIAATMEGGLDRSLERDAGFRELVGHLPARPLGLLYAVAGKPSTKPLRIPLLLPSADRILLGLYESDGRIDLAARATLRQPQTTGPVSAVALERMFNLPQSTLLAIAANVDVGQSISAAARTQGTSVLARYVRLLRGLQGGSGDSAPEARLGPNLVLAWGQDLSDRGTTPQLALLIESDHAEASARSVSDMVQQGLGMLEILDSGEDNRTPAIETTSRLGTRVSYVALGDLAERSSVSWVKLLAGLEPAWAASGNWLIVALTREHLERIIDAQHGLIPNLGLVREARAAIKEPGERNVLAVFRGGMAGDVLRRWLESQARGEPSLLDPQWWAPAATAVPAGQKHLGIGMRGRQEAGAVVVARIHAGSPADGRLQEGDRVVGVDGMLLELHAPNASLRRMIAESESPEGPTLRVLRGDQWIEVVLPKPATPTELPAPDPVGLVRALSTLADSLEFASVAILPTRDNRFTARLSVRFAPVSKP